MYYDSFSLPHLLTTPFVGLKLNDPLNPSFDSDAIDTTLLVLSLSCVGFHLFQMFRTKCSNTISIRSNEKNTKIQPTIQNDDGVSKEDSGTKGNLNHEKCKDEGVRSWSAKNSKVGKK